MSLTEIDVARAGRKRKAKGYMPGHHSKTAEKNPDDRTRTSRQPHRRVLDDKLRLDERAESPLGRLNLTNVISDDQYDAGCRYAAVVGAYRAVINAPRMTQGSGHLLMGEKPRPGEMIESALPRFACEDCPAGTAEDACGCRARKRRYDDAYEVLFNAGQRSARAVARVAIWREELVGEEIVYLKIGLAALARHFGLTRRGESGQSRNAH